MNISKAVGAPAGFEVGLAGSIGATFGAEHGEELGGGETVDIDLHETPGGEAIGVAAGLAAAAAIGDIKAFEVWVAIVVVAQSADMVAPMFQVERVVVVGDAPEGIGGGRVVLGAKIPIPPGTFVMGDLGLRAQGEGLAALGSAVEGAVDDVEAEFALLRFQQAPGPAAVGNARGRIAVVVQVGVMGHVPVLDAFGFHLIGVGRGDPGLIFAHEVPAEDFIERITVEALEGGGAFVGVVEEIGGVLGTNPLKDFIFAICIAPGCGHGLLLGGEVTVRRGEGPEGG